MAAITGNVGQQLTDMSSSTGLTVPGNAQKALVSSTGTHTVRYYQDGRTPSASAGHPLPHGSHVVIGKDQLATTRFCEEGTGAILEVTYYDNLDDLTALDS